MDDCMDALVDGVIDGGKMDGHTMKIWELTSVDGKIGGWMIGG
jgi:hypothetical protein